MDIGTIIEKIDHINSFGDDRVLILYCSLYVEDYVVKLYSQAKGNPTYGNCECCGKSKEPGFLKKVRELADNGYINKEVGHDSIVEDIWKHRGPAVHEIHFDINTAIKSIETYIESSKKNDPHGLLEKLFKNINWQKKLQMPIIAVVFSLQQTLNNLLGVPITQKLEFEIDPACTNIRPKITNIN